MSAFSHLVPPEEVKKILNATLDTLESSEFAAKLNEAKENAGNEMLKMMQIVFPLVAQVQMDILKRYGYSSTREGIVQFTQLVRGMEQMDSEIARLHAQIRVQYLPPVSISSAVDTSL